MNGLDYFGLVFALAFESGLVYVVYKLHKSSVREKLALKEKFNEERKRVVQSKEFQLTREIAQILGKELKCIHKPLGVFQYASRRLYYVERGVYDSESGEAMNKTNQGIVEDATYIDGDKQMIRLFKYLVIREPQPAIELLKELFSISFGALSQTDAMGIDNSNRKEFLRNKIKEFCVRILNLCVYQSESAQDKDHVKPEKKNVYMLR